MSLYGVLRSGTSGMNAQSSRLGVVADNIQNQNTTGYKRGETEFFSLLIDSSTGNYDSVSAVSTPETERGSSQTEDGWFIVALRHEDETDVRAGTEAGRSRDQGHPPRDTPAVLGR